MKKLAVLFVIFALLVIAAPVSAGEPPTDLSGSFDPSGSLELFENVVWLLPEGATDLRIAPDPYDATGVTIELDTKRIELAPSADTTISGKRVMVVKGVALLWSTTNPYATKGWSPKGGVPVVKTGPMASGLFGPPPPKGTPLPPEPTATLPPEPTPVSPTPVPPAPEVKFALRDDGHLLVTYDGGQVWEDLGEVQGPAGTDGAQGPPGTGPSVEELAEFVIKGEVVPALLSVIVPELKVDREFQATVRGEKGDRGEKGEKGEAGAAGVGVQGPPGPGVSDNFLNVLLGTFFIAFLGFAAAILGWWHRKPDALWAKIDEVLAGMEGWTKALEDRLATTVFKKFTEELDEKLGAIGGDHAQLKQGLREHDQNINILTNRADGQARQLTEHTQATKQLESQVEQIGATSNQTKGELLIRFNTLKEQIAALKVEIAPLAPKPAVESNGRLRCPGCNGFVARIAEGFAGHCKRCGVSYVIPAPTPEMPVEEKVTEEAAAEAN